MKIEVTPEQNILVDGVEYLAKKSDSCSGCVLEDESLKVCPPAPCTWAQRDSFIAVIFVKPEVAA